MTDGFIAIGFGRAAIPFWGNCYLNLSAVGGVVGPGKLSGGFPGSGMMNIALLIPSFLPSGTVVTIQGGVVDMSVASVITTTRGIEVITK